MKAKLYIGIIIAVILPGFMAQAQVTDSRDYINDNAGTVINNYYNYDYYYSSRINRFHRSFLTFNYYAPLFTDSFWYNYEPSSWGLSIYGGTRLGLSFSYNYPVYNDYSWNYPYYSGYYYQGFDPFYYNRWYSPVVINLGIWNRWDHNYSGWQGANRWDYYYRPGYNNHNNNYYSDSRSDNRHSDSDISKRSESENNRSANNTVPRRPGSNYTQTEIIRDNKNISGNYGHNSDNTVETRRGVNHSDNKAPVNVNRSINNNGSNSNGSTINSSNGQINRRSEQSPGSSQSNVSNRLLHPGLNGKPNTDRSLIRSEYVSSSDRRSNVKPENKTGSGRSVTTGTRSSSTPSKSVSSSTSKKSSSKTGSNATRKSSSEEKSKKE